MYDWTIFFFFLTQNACAPKISALTDCTYYHYATTTTTTNNKNWLWQRGRFFKELLGGWTVDDLHNNGRLASFSFVPFVYTLANFLSLVILFYTLTSTHFISSVRLIHNMRVKAEERHSLRLFFFGSFCFIRNGRGGEGQSNLHFFFY